MYPSGRSASAADRPFSLDGRLSRSCHAAAVDALKRLTSTEGVIPALESAHAVAHAIRLAPRLRRTQAIIVNLSGRGDKDMNTVAERSGLKFFCQPECDPAKR